MKELIEKIANMAEAQETPGDYIQDGLLYCGHCRTPKQCRIKLNGADRIMGCQCACEIRRYEAEQKAFRDQEMRMKMESKKNFLITDRRIRSFRFSSAEDSPGIQKARKYADQFEDMQAGCVGLLFWGPPQTGKTFAAACIANELIGRGVEAMMTSFPYLLSMSYQDRFDMIEKMVRCPLLILDDLGAERQNEFAMETVYLVVDKRNKAGKPLIVTTNLPLKEIQNPKSTDYERIYSRILEVCVPVLFNGKRYRTEEARKKVEAIRVKWSEET